MPSMRRRRERSCCIIRVSFRRDLRGRYQRHVLTTDTEKLLSNGDKWEPELAASIRADAPYR